MVDLKLKVERPQVIWRQVADQVRSKIYSGELAPGMKLPSTAAMAAMAGADVRAVHRALTDLVREGLITRARKVGTHVRERQTKISRLGIYHTADTEGHLRNAFTQGLHDALQRQSHENNVHTRIWTDQRPSDQQAQPLPEIEAAARDRLVEGIVSTISDSSHIPWLSKLKVPVVSLGDIHASSTVSTDMENFWHLTFSHFQKIGCRTVGILSPVSTKDDLLKFYLELAPKYGITISQDWMIYTENGFEQPGFEYARYGYQGFKELWRKPTHPEGFVVYPDECIPGVLLAIAEAQVRIPEDIQLVFHKNEGIDYFCPVPVTYVSVNIPKIAKALLSQLEDIYNGRACHPILVDHMMEHYLPRFEAYKA